MRSLSLMVKQHRADCDREPLCGRERLLRQFDSNSIYARCVCGLSLSRVRRPISWMSESGWLFIIGATIGTLIACNEASQLTGPGAGGEQAGMNDATAATTGGVNSRGGNNGGGGGSGGAGTTTIGAGGNVAEAGIAESGVVDTGSMDAGQTSDGASDASSIAVDSAVETNSEPSGSPICGSAEENEIVTLTCLQGEIVDQIAFASYGTPTGECGGFVAGACNATTSTQVVEDLCVGRATCIVPASNGSFGDPCRSTVKRLVIEASCVPGTPTIMPKPFKGVANSPCEARKALSVSWYYNWMQNETEPCNDDGGGEFVPMIWGHSGPEQNAADIATSVASFVSKGYAYVLGFNEPDNPDQANIPVGLAIELWPAFDNSAIEVVSPSTTANAERGQPWFTDFMAQVNSNPNLRADVLAIHWYGWNAGSCDTNASQLENYIRWAEGFAGGRPIWITEWGCLNQSAPDVATVVAFFHGALAVFERHPRVERYAWYPWFTNCGLVNQDGSLTALGEAYAAAPAYK